TRMSRMYRNRCLRLPLGLSLCVASLTMGVTAQAQNNEPAPSVQKIQDPVVQKIQAGNTRMELTVNTSRILSMDSKIPKVQVGNPELLDFTALAEDQIQLHAKKPGITSVNLWDEDGDVHSVDVVVVGDVRELDMVLKQQFPTATVKLFPTAASTL